MLHLAPRAPGFLLSLLLRYALLDALRLLDALLLLDALRLVYLRPLFATKPSALGNVAGGALCQLDAIGIEIARALAPCRQFLAYRNRGKACTHEDDPLALFLRRLL